MKIIKILSEAIRILQEQQQAQKQADFEESTRLNRYIDVYFLRDDYNDFLSYNRAQNSLENMRRFITDSKRINHSRAVVSMIYTNDLQRSFLFFKRLPEFCNKTIDEQLAIFPEWYEQNGTRKVVL